MSKNFITLSIETTIGAGSISVFSNEKELLSENLSGQVSKASDILSFTQKIFSRINVAKDSVDLIAVSVGAGSATGQRIGLSFAKGFARAQNCVLVEVSLFKAMCFVSGINGIQKILVSSGKNSFSYQTFHKQGNLEITPLNIPQNRQIKEFPQKFYENREFLVFEKILFSRISNTYMDLIKESKFKVLERPLSSYISNLTTKIHASDNE